SHDARDWFYYRGELPVPEASFSTHSMSSQWHGDGDAFGKILNAYSYSKCDGTGYAGIFDSNCCSTKQYSYCKSFGNVVQCDGEYQQRCLVQFSLHTFRFTQTEIQVEVRRDFIEEEDEQCTEKKANRGGNPTQFRRVHFLRHLDGGT